MSLAASPTPLRPAQEAWLTAGAVTVAVTIASAYAPTRWVASVVGATFLGATWIMVFRKDDAAVVRAGLSFAGLVLPEPIDVKRLGRAFAASVGWALLLGLVFFGPFVLGFRAYAHTVWHAPTPPSIGGQWLAAHASTIARETLGQVALIALPEEVFYRGYLQSRFDDAWPPTVRILGAVVGPSIVVTSAIFALGHLLTIHDAGRLAVFFPSLLFGYLRARTGGVGASVAFHAACNIFSATLLQAYGPR